MIGLGLLLKNLLPDTAWATYTYILVSYHLILAFKVFVTNKKAGLALPLLTTMLTHMACVGLLIGFAIARHQIPFFGIVRYFIPGLAPFEAEWLFNGEKAKPLPADQTFANLESASLETSTANLAAAQPAAAIARKPVVAAVSAYDNSTGEEYEEFLKMMQQGKRPFRKPGLTVKGEYELWLTSRAKKHAAAEAAASRRSA